MANYASVHANSNYLENIMDLHLSTKDDFYLDKDIGKELLESGKKNNKDIKDYTLENSFTENIKNTKNINKAASIKKDEYNEIELDEYGCQSLLPPYRSTHWCESKKKCIKLKDKCEDWETDINIIIKEENERLDFDKMKLDDDSLFINNIDVYKNESVDVNRYGIIECILLVLISISLLVFLIRNHRN